MAILSRSLAPAGANSSPSARTAPSAMTMSPAAGPLIVSWELLRKQVRMPPMTAVQMPAIGGYLLAVAMPRHNGIAIRNTRNPDSTSNFRFGSRPGVSGGAADGEE